MGVDPSLLDAARLQIESMIDVVPIVILAIFLLIILASTIRVVREYERIVVFRLGRLLGAKGPGVVIVLPALDRVRKIDLRLFTLDVPKQRIITKDNVLWTLTLSYTSELLRLF